MKKKTKNITDEDIARKTRRLIRGFKKYGGAVIKEDIKLLKELAKY